ncbi:MAG TPA: IS200/IS605 family transposase [Candidatus Angelobacter sp.]|nr:IS200/IS605 family transposase [Candidatus Angelobacter sp.]
MSHAYTRNHVHLVFSTKERRKSIAAAVQPELWSYMAGICRNQKMVSVAIGGVDDHVHLLFHLPASMALSRAITLIKANSSKWMNEHGRNFAWQEGYVRSVSALQTWRKSRSIFGTRKSITSK